MTRAASATSTTSARADSTNGVIAEVVANVALGTFTTSQEFLWHNSEHRPNEGSHR